MNMHIAYFFGTNYWRKGLATELLRGLVVHSEDCTYHAIFFCAVVVDNTASSRVLIKAGFTEDAPSVEGKVDTLWYKRSFTK